MKVCNILLKKSNAELLVNKQMQHHEENVFFRYNAVCHLTLIKKRQYN